MIPYLLPDHAANVLIVSCCKPVHLQSHTDGLSLKCILQASRLQASPLMQTQKQPSPRSLLEQGKSWKSSLA